MRISFVLLLVANIAYFAWHSYFQSGNRGAAPQNKALAASLPQLELLGEERGIVPGNARDVRKQEGITAGGGLILGGFYEEKLAGQLRQRLLGVGVNGHIVQYQMEAEQEYWVYMPPLSSRAATLRLLKELQARKLDGFLITQGELSNGISLGIFQHENSAQAMFERLQQGGYQAKVKKISRQRPVYWFKVSASSERLIDETMLQALQNDFPGLQLSQAH